MNENISEKYEEKERKSEVQERGEREKENIFLRICSFYIKKCWTFFLCFQYSIYLMYLNYSYFTSNL